MFDLNGLTFGTNGHEFDALAGNVVQSFVDVGDLVESHFAAIGLR